jgi:hypothetical protein
MLVTLNDIKTFLGIPLVNTEYDAILTVFQESVEQSIINYCQTDFATHAIVGPPGEILDGGRQDVLIPKNFPIISVERVYFNVNVDGTGGYQLGSTDYFYDEGSITLRSQHAPFARGIVRLDYTYGYAAVPGDVKAAVYQSVKAEFQRYKKNSEDISSRSKGDESESFGTGNSGAWDPLTGLPRQIVAKLQAYRLYEFPNINMAQRNL